MYKKILIGGVTAAAIIGAGGTAMAVSGSNTTPGTPTGSGATTSSSHHGSKSGKHEGRHAFGIALRQVEHGQIVTRKKGGTVTHDFIRGTVSAVSGTSITVQAADNTSETFVVGPSTKVRVRDNGKGTASSIAGVHATDRVVVLGTGTSTFTATHIVDLRGAKVHDN